MALRAHVVEVLVVAPAHDHILDAASLLVDAQLSVVPALVRVEKRSERSKRAFPHLES